MGILSTLAAYLAALGIPLLLLRAYLDLNKKWSRKHIPEVADSISIGSHGVISLTVFVFSLQSLLNAQWSLTTFYLIALLWNTTIIVIGSGIFVPENRHLGFGALLLRALRLERAESTNLLRTFTNPKGTRQIMVVLRQLAALDNRIAQEEIDLIQQFARSWRVPPPALSPGLVPPAERVELDDIRQSVQAYLRVEPPAEQALQMLDLLKLFIAVDKDISELETVIIDEVTGLVHEYADEVGTTTHIYEVRVVPQSEKQRRAVRESLPHLETSHVRGSDSVIIVGRFYSERYAEIVSQKYRDFGLFSKAELLQRGRVA